MFISIFFTLLINATTKIYSFYSKILIKLFYIIKHHSKNEHIYMLYYKYKIKVKSKKIVKIKRFLAKVCMTRNYAIHTIINYFNNYQCECYYFIKCQFNKTN